MAKQIKKLKTPNLEQMFTPELLGQAIKARRTQSNLRLEDTAALCGVAKQTLLNIEHGHPTSQLSSILQVCLGLGIKLRILPAEKQFPTESSFHGNGRDVANIREGASLPKLFAFANQCENPVLTKQQILDWVLFNLLIFNSDAHGKNISFFVDEKGIKLAPFYDLVNIGLYPQFEHKMAMAFGDEFDGNKIYSYQLADLAKSCYLVKKRLNYLTEKMMHIIDSTIEKPEDIIPVGIHHARMAEL